MIAWRYLELRFVKQTHQSLYLQVPHENGVVNIVTLHGQVGVVSGVGQVNISKLKNKGIDYLALGHIHTYAEQTLDGKGIYCYSGCLEGRGFVSVDRKVLYCLP